MTETNPTQIILQILRAKCDLINSDFSDDAKVKRFTEEDLKQEEVLGERNKLEEIFSLNKFEPRSWPGIVIAGSKVGCLLGGLINCFSH